MVTYFIYIFHFVLNYKILLRSLFLPCSFLPLHLLFCFVFVTQRPLVPGVCGGVLPVTFPYPVGKSFSFEWDRSKQISVAQVSPVLWTVCGQFSPLSRGVLVNLSVSHRGLHQLTPVSTLAVCIVVTQSSVSHAAAWAPFPSIWAWTVFCYRD